MNRRLARACSPFLDTPIAPITDEQLILFHSLDCELYARLVLSSHRNPDVSMKVVAFWIWLERENHDTRLMRRIQILPPTELNKLVDETVTCLECVDCENEFLIGNREISLLPSLMSLWFKMTFSLRKLHGKRVRILGEVDMIVNTVCVRAFKGIMQKALDEKAAMQAVVEPAV